MGIGTLSRDVVQYCYALFRYILRRRLVWITTLALIVALVVVCWFASEATFRRVGLVLQLLGIAAVVWDIEGTRQLFGLPTTLAAALQKIHDRPRFRRPIVIGLVEGASATDTVSTGRLVGWHTAPADATLEDRIVSVEVNLKVLEGLLGDLARHTRNNLDGQVKALEEEKRLRVEENSSIREKLKTSQVAGLDISMAGVVCLVVGVTMSTIPSELTCLAHLIFS